LQLDRGLLVFEHPKSLFERSSTNDSFKGEGIIEVFVCATY